MFGEYLNWGPSFGAGGSGRAALDVILVVAYRAEATGCWSSRWVESIRVGM